MRIAVESKAELLLDVSRRQCSAVPSKPMKVSAAMQVYNKQATLPVLPGLSQSLQRVAN